MAKSKVKYQRGFINDSKGNPILDQHSAWEKDAECGCGIDCCKKELVLTDKTSSNKTSLYFEAGDLIVEVDGVGRFRATLTAI